MTLMIKQKTALVLTLALSLPLVAVGHAHAEDESKQEEPVTTEALVSQFQDFVAQVQRHPNVQKLTDSLTSGEWLTSLNELWEEYAGMFSQMSQIAEEEFADLQERVETFAKQADEVIAESDPHDNAVGKAKAAAQALEERMQEQKEILDSIE